MHILLTDRLACPRCGPGFGLILLADRLDERRVLEGALACSNCRARYPVKDGFADLRSQPHDPGASDALDRTPDPEEAVRLAALLGIQEGTGLVALLGRTAAHASILSRLVEGIEVIAVHQGLRDSPEEAGVSRIGTSWPLPFLTGSIRGVALDADADERQLAEISRILSREGRLVRLGRREPPFPQDTAGLMSAHGFDVLAEDEQTLVCVRKSP